MLIQEMGKIQDAILIIAYILIRVGHGIAIVCNIT